MNSSVGEDFGPTGSNGLGRTLNASGESSQEFAIRVVDHLENICSESVTASPTIQSTNPTGIQFELPYLRRYGDKKSGRKGLRRNNSD